MHMKCRSSVVKRRERFNSYDVNQPFGRKGEKSQYGQTLNGGLRVRCVIRDKRNFNSPYFGGYWPLTRGTFARGI